MQYNKVVIIGSLLFLSACGKYYNTPCQNQDYNDNTYHDATYQNHHSYYDNTIHHDSGYQNHHSNYQTNHNTETKNKPQYVPQSRSNSLKILRKK